MPYAELSLPIVAMMRRVIDGERPHFLPNARERGLSDELRELIEHCWTAEPSERPVSADVCAIVAECHTKQIAGEARPLEMTEESSKSVS